MGKLTPDQQRVQNRQHEQWLALPATQELITRLTQWAELRPVSFREVGDVAVYQANALVQAGYQEVLNYIKTPPYPDVDRESMQNVFNFDYEDVN